MTEWDNFRLVLGYLPEIDRLPKTAATLGLPCRVAAVLNHPDIPYSELYWDMVAAFVESLEHDSVIFEIDTNCDSITSEIVTDDVRLVFTSVDAMREYVERPPARFGVAFSRAAFSLHNEVTAFIDTAPYGPEPYYDAWIFDIYRKTDEVTRLRDACYSVCSQHGVPILDEIQGLPAPQAAPLWKRLLQWLLK